MPTGSCFIKTRKLITVQVEQNSYLIFGYKTFVFSQNWSLGDINEKMVLIFLQIFDTTNNHCINPKYLPLNNLPSNRLPSNRLQSTNAPFAVDMNSKLNVWLK